MKLKMLIGLAACLAFKAGADTNLLINGSFEAQGVPPTPGFIVADVYGWTPIGSGADVLVTGYSHGSASDGANFVDIIGSPDATPGGGPFPVGISQDVFLNAGISYELVFDYNGDTSNPRSLDYSLGSLVTGNVDVSGLNAFLDFGPVTPWVTVSNTFTPSISGNYTLAFTTAAGSFGSPYLDNISITPVPEPSVMALIGIALFAVLAINRRRKQASSATKRI